MFLQALVSIDELLLNGMIEGVLEIGK